MIVKGQTRTADTHWIRHLQRADHNEEVRVVEARDLAHADIDGAIREMDAYAIGSRCKKPLFDVIVRGTDDRPPTEAELHRAVEHIEAAYPGLRDRPRLIVGHVKDGHEHWHVCWARCGAEGPAVNLPWTKTRLMEVSLAMYREMGVEPPAGVLGYEATKSKAERQPTGDIDTATFKAAERQGIDARDLSAIVCEAWQQPDFALQMRKAGYEIAKGDRRGFVLVDHAGNVLGLRGLLKPLGVKAKDMRERLGEEEKAQSIEEAQAALQPTDRDRVALFNEASHDKSAAAIIPLKTKLDSVQRKLDAMKKQQREIAQEQEKAAQDALRAKEELQADLAEFDNPHAAGSTTIFVIKPGASFEDTLAASITVTTHEPAVQGIEAARATLRERHRQQRQQLVDQLRELKREVKRLTLAQHAARMVQMVKDSLRKLATRHRPEPAPEVPQGEAIAPIPQRVRVAEQFREAFREMDEGKTRDRGRERPGPGAIPPRRPPKGPGL